MPPAQTGSLLIVGSVASNSIAGCFKFVKLALIEVVNSYSIPNSATNLGRILDFAPDCAPDIHNTIDEFTFSVIDSAFRNDVVEIGQKG